MACAEHFSVIIAFFSLGVTSSGHSPIPYGMSFKLWLDNDTATSVFSTLLPVLMPQKNCIVDGFMQVDSDLNVNNISLTSDCLGLKLSMLQFPNAFRHVVYFNGQNHLSKNDHDTSVIVYSRLETSRVMIGNFFEVFTSDFKSIAMEVAFSSKTLSTTGHIRNVNVSLFDSQIYAEELAISNEYLSFKGYTVIFNHFNIHVIGKSSTKNNINSLALELEGEIVDDVDGFKTKLSNTLNSHVKSEIELAIERQRNAHLLHEAANDFYIKISNQYDNVKLEYDSLLLELLSVNESYQNMKSAVQDTRNAFLKEYNKSMMDLGDVLCSQEFCNLNCEDSNQCSICDSFSKIEETEICETSLSKSRVTTFYQLVESQSWRYDTKCYDCWKLEWYLLPYFSPSKCCFTVSVPYSEYRNEPYQDTENYLKAHYNSCKTDEIAANTSIQCCEDYKCAFTFHNVSCLASNTDCLKEKKELVQHSGSPSLQLQYDEYSTAITDFVTSEIRLVTIEAKLFVLKQELMLLEDAKENAFDIKDIRETAEQTITNLTEVYNSLDSNVQLKILNISFDIIITDTTPVSFPLQFLVECEENIREITVIVDFQKSLESIYRHVSVEIMANIVSGSRLRKRRDVAMIENSNHFAATCAELAVLKTFAEQIVHSFDSFEKQTNDNIETVNDMFLELELPPNIEEIETYHLMYSNVELEVNSLISRLRNVLEQYSFIYWQNGQEMLYSNDSNVNGYDCIDQIDCLLIALYDIASILKDTPLEEAELIFQNIALIKQDILSSQYNVSHTRVAMKQLLDLFLGIEKLDYWCSEPPIFIEQPSAQTNIMAGKTLQLSCNVESKLPVTYYWMRDSQLLNIKSSTVTIRDIQTFEGGNYQCIVANDAGSVLSAISIVNVYTLPVFNLTLEPKYETYAGDDSGLTFTCDAYGLPSPGWKWLYKSTLDDDWREIDHSHSNVLAFSKVEFNREGYYACSAFNVIGNITSNVTFFQVLPAEIVQLEYPVEFTFSFKSEQTIATENNSSLQELVKNKIKQNLLLNSTQIKSVSIVVRDGLHRVSFSLTTPYQTFNSNMSMEELVALLSPLITELEINKYNMTYATLENILDIEDAMIELIPGSLNIGPRHFACSNGYETHSSQSLCGKSFFILNFLPYTIYYIQLDVVQECIVDY